MSKSIYSCIAMLLLALVPATAVIAAEPYTAGKEYQLVEPPQPTNTGNKVEVLELFWYGCPHCYSFEGPISRWLKNKPANASFVRLPAVLNPSWATLARAFYTAETLGKQEVMHEALFETIHELKKRLSDEAAIMQVFKEHGVSEADFKKTWRSFAVDARVRRARDLSARYGARGVPTIIVNGKYRTSATLTGSHEATLKVVDFLIKKESGK